MTLFTASLILLLTTSGISVPLHPVLLIHGYYGTRLLYTVDRSVPGSPILCPSKPVNETLWLNLLNFFDPVSNACWLQAASLHYDRRTRKSHSAPGVRVTTTAFGDLQGSEWLTPIPVQIYDTSYFVWIVRQLTTLGYVRNKSLRLAQYDWRRAPNENTDWISNTKTLIEHMFAQNGNKSVILITHSMASQFSYIFLNQMPVSWRNQYIRSYILIASNFGGVFKFLYSYFGSNDYPANLFPVTRPAIRTYSTTSLLLPRLASFGNETLIRSANGDLKAEDYESFFSSLGFVDAYEQWKDVRGLYDPNDLKSPGDFSIYCISGSGVQTLERAIFNGPISRTTSFESIYGDGDSFVNIQSLRLCNRLGTGKKNFGVKVFLGKDHLQIIRDPEPVNYVTGVVDSINYGVEKFSEQYN